MEPALAAGCGSPVLSGVRRGAVPWVLILLASISGSGCRGTPGPDAGSVAVPLAQVVAEEQIPQSVVANPGPDESRPQALDPKPEAVKSVVSIVGGVVTPGTYALPGRARVQHLIEAAGGLRGSADIHDINVAAYLIDGTTLHIPELRNFPAGGERIERTGAPSPSYARNLPQYTRSGWRPEQAEVRPISQVLAVEESVPPSTESTDSLIDLNSASQQQLETLPGIGPKTAEKIIAFRKQTLFQRVEDLMQVPGIAEKKLAAVRHLVKVD